MNRLVIIGNGFDLAHSLPTSYKNFMDDLWMQIVENSSFFNYLIYLDNINYDITPIKSNCDFNKLTKCIEEYCEHSKNKYSQLSWNSKELHFFAVHLEETKIREILYFKNNFFKIITLKQIDNWVDIENEYYYQLKKIIKSKSLDITYSEEYWKNEQKKLIKTLNNEFNDIKKLFENYIIKEVENSFEMNKKEKGENDWTKFYHILKPISLFNNEHNISLEFNDKLDKEELENLLIKQRTDNTVQTKSLLLNFNYTSTLNKYINSFKEGEIDVSLNQIHGKINDSNNKMNFGFGDEMDDDYKAIENINDNEYLRNFKSFQYLQNSNYSNLLSYIDSEKFQVLIMGHSCGLSDRTLLNTIFEHENCRSIKVFYHQKKDGSDNYTEIIQNISRHFNKKKLMREKIVNKTLCQPLPQIQLSRKG